MVTPTLDTPFGAPPGSWWLDVEYPCRSEPRSFLADRVVSVCRPGDSLGRRLGRMVCIICKDRPVRAWVADQPANPGRGQFAPPATVRVQLVEQGAQEQSAPAEPPRGGRCALRSREDLGERLMAEGTCERWE